MKRALITGVTGQDGTYLASHLLSLGYEVFGGARHGFSVDTFRQAPELAEVKYLPVDMRDALSVELAVRKSQPQEIYNLAGQTFVPPSWTLPVETFNVNLCGLARVLQAVEAVDKTIKVYQASSSEMYGEQKGFMNEKTDMEPASPYGVSKLAAHKLVQVYRNKGLFVCAGILFNHESPRRGPEMVTRKVTKHVAMWVTGSEEPLVLGNMNASRDWGFAGDYVQAMHTMLQQTVPDDYVIGTGETHTIEELVKTAIEAAGLDPMQYAPLVQTSQQFRRASDISFMCADTAKAQHILQWRPNTTFKKLIQDMVWYDTLLCQAAKGSRTYEAQASN